MNVHDALEYLETLEVSSDDETADEVDFVSRENLFILPPAQVDGRDTDEDSGDENELLPNNFSLNQLLNQLLRAYYDWVKRWIGIKKIIYFKNINFYVVFDY